MLVSRLRLGRLAVLGAVLVIAFLAQVPSAGALAFQFEKAFGPDGTSAAGFTSGGSVAVDQKADLVYVLDRQGDALFKFDLNGTPVAFGGSSPNISGNELSGLEIGGAPGTRQVAVNSDTHTIYLTGGENGEERATALQAFQASGEPALFTAGPGAGTNQITGFPGIRGVAVDSVGNIYVSGTKEGPGVAENISIYRESGSLLGPTIKVSASANLAVDANGVVYVMRNSLEVARYDPSEFPPKAETTYTGVVAAVDPHFAISIAVDPLENQLYVIEDFEEGGSHVTRIAIYDEDGVLQGAFGGQGEPGELGLAEGIGVGGEGGISKPFVSDQPEGDLSQVKIFKEVLIEAPPTIASTAATVVTGDSATLRARVNPNNRETTYWFEYGPEDCELAPCVKVPFAGASIGDGRKLVSVTQAVSGLTPLETYFIRVVAENVFGTSKGPLKSFTTQGSSLGFTLSDARVWEMVSPSQKFGGLLINAAGTTIRASVSGDKLIYASRGSIVEDPVSNRLAEPATVLGKRKANGEWDSTDLTPTHTVASRVAGTTPYKAFSDELLEGLLEPTDDTPLSAEASEQTPYRWSDVSPPTFTPLINPSNIPAGTKFGPSAEAGASNNPIRLEGASPDLSHVALRSQEVPLVEGAVPGSLYMWTEGSLELVSELPEAEGEAAVVGMLGSGRGSVRHAISTDGSLVFWAPSTGYNAAGIKLPALYLRNTVSDRSLRLDVVQPGASGAGEALPAFSAASADGDVAFFTDSQQLTEGASPSGRDLYRCEVGAVDGGSGCVSVIDITAPIEGSGESAEVLDQVSGFSEDGTRLYFVARGVLDEAPNELGETPESGEPNLYFWEEDEGLQFIATLANGDFRVWGGEPSLGFSNLISASASPSGRYFAFTSEKSLTGYENRNSDDQATTEAFVYDAEAKGAALICVSCKPTGAAAGGEFLPKKVNFFPPDPASLWESRWVAATLPEPQMSDPEGRSLYRPRAVLDNGSVFFNAIDSLVPADSNGEWDVYQYEPVGLGTCAEETDSAGAVRSSEGCVGLLSSGTSEGDAGFLDSSPSGEDVFFLTRGRLSVLDMDNELDAYDARVNGIKGVLKPIQECAGEACQPAASPPNDPSAASESFHGAKTPINCRKGQHRVHRNGKTVCEKKKQKKHKRGHQKPANGNGRARR